MQGYLAIWNSYPACSLYGKHIPAPSSYTAQPFGHGLVTMAQRTDFTLRLWSLDDLSNPVHQYIGHANIITGFDWRVKDINGIEDDGFVTLRREERVSDCDLVQRSVSTTVVCGQQSDRGKCTFIAVFMVISGDQ